MKKIISITLSLLLMFSFVACTNKNAKGDAVSEESKIGIPNPMVEYATIDEAQTAIGFTLKTITAIPDGFSQDKVFVIDKTLAQIDYKSGENKITYRMAKGTDDISGDYNKYENVKECKTAFGNAKLSGTKDGYSLANFADADYTYAILVDKAMSEADFISLVESVK